MKLYNLKKIELQNDGTFKLTQLLRGQYGTEQYISTHTSNEKFIFLNKGLIKQQYTNNDIDTSYDYKFITFKDSFDNATNKTLKITGINTKPLNVCHIKILDLANGDYKIRWIPRIRGDYNWKDGTEKLENKNYVLTIKDNNNNILRTINIQNSTEFTYTNEMIVEDGGGEWKVELVEV